MALEATLTRAWLRRGPLALTLWPLSLLFGALSGSRRALYRAGVLRAEKLPVPVIVVGNIFIGGTGKTPLTIWLASVLRDAGFHPGVISRGHGRAGEEALAVHAASSSEDVGDEPLLIAQRAQCPVVVGRRRVQAGRSLLAAHPEVDVIISDDGLQHYSLARDLEIVLFDARGVGNGFLLPAGPLREPPSRRRDFTVVNGAEMDGAYRMRLVGEIAVPLNGGPPRALADIKGKRIAAAAGIGNPDRFFAMLRAAGLRMQELPLPDHHDFRDDPFAAVDADIILITEKDAVKCRQRENINSDPRVWVVPVTAQLDAALAEQIVEKCRGCSTA